MATSKKKQARKLSFWNWLVIVCKGTFGGGLPSVFEYLLGILNDKVLCYVTPEEMAKYAGLIMAVADLGDRILELYDTSESKKKAMQATVKALRSLAEYVEDGKVTEEELEAAIEVVANVISEWKSLRDIVPVADKL